MENLEDLRRICQKPREKYDTWYGLRFCRKISIHITRALIPLKVSGGFMTLVFLAVGILGCFILTGGTKWSFLIGTLTLELWYLVDHVDGELARYYGKESATGAYYDKLVHFSIHPSIMFFLAVGLYRLTWNFNHIIAGFLSSIFISFVFMEQDMIDATVLQKAAIDGKDLFLSRRGASRGVKEQNIFKMAFSLLHKSCTVPYKLHILTFAAIANMIINGKIMIFAFYLYFAVTALICSARVYVVAKNKRIDSALNEWSKS